MGGQKPKHVEDPESVSLLSDKGCHRCATAANSSRTRHVFKTIVLIALAYICFLETNTRLAVKNHETHVHLTGEIPYCKPQPMSLYIFLRSGTNVLIVTSSLKRGCAVCSESGLARWRLVSVHKETGTGTGCLVERDTRG